MTDRYAHYVGRYIVVARVACTPFVTKVTGVTPKFFNLSPNHLTVSSGSHGPTRIMRSIALPWLIAEGQEEHVAARIDAETKRHRAAMAAESAENSRCMAAIKNDFKDESI